MNDLMIPKTLLDYCAIREKVLFKIERAYSLLEEAKTEFKEICQHGLPYDSTPRNGFTETQKAIEETLWRTAFDKTGFMQIMDAEAKDKFFAEVKENPPAFTEKNIRSTFLSLAQEAELMFARGLVNVFLRLSKDHKTNTNSPFKVNERAVLGYMVEQNWGGGLRVHYSGHASERLNDIDRVFKTLDDQKHDPRALEHAVNIALANSVAYADDYYQIKGYKNGNMHILFKRQDLLEKANKIIHDYYHGSALAA